MRRAPARPGIARRSVLKGLAALPASMAWPDLPPLSEPMPVAGRARPVLQWIAFGALNPELVARAPAVLDLTHSSWRLLQALAGAPRVTVYDEGDLAHRTLTNGNRGNCVTAALTWMRDAAAEGIPLGAITPAICAVCYAAKPHLLPVVHTDAGAFAVEPFFRSIARWRVLPYRWDRRLVALNQWGKIAA